VPPYLAPNKRFASSIRSSSPFLFLLFGREVSGFGFAACVVSDDDALDSSGSSGGTSWVASPCKAKGLDFFYICWSFGGGLQIFY
jgi:hypothetical protein